jgi:hypothetical protein
MQRAEFHRDYAGHARRRGAAMLTPLSKTDADGV